MTQITVSAELARAISESPLPIVLVDPQGRTLGQMTRIESDAAEKRTVENEWAEAKRRMEQAKRAGGPFYTTNEVLAHIQSLERK